LHSDQRYGKLPSLSLVFVRSALASLIVIVMVDVVVPSPRTKQVFVSPT
jgi:hypothetical protein